MSQRGVQLVIGKLLTDVDFRRRFEAHAGECLAGLRQPGIHLNEREIAALVAMDPRVWSKIASQMDPGLERAVSEPAVGTTPRRRRDLTERQERVLSRVCAGLSNKEIAAEERVSESAVKGTLQQLFRKMRVRRRAQLVRLAVEGAFMARVAR